MEFFYIYTQKVSFPSIVLEGYYLEQEWAKLYEVVTRYLYLTKISRQQSSQFK